ncbi:MAG: aquaporin [Chloroflexota bacterium]
MEKEYSLDRRLFAELLGSLLLVFTAISPIILAHNAMESSVAMAVLINAMAVGFVLFVLIETLGPISGCHINPAVTLAMLLTKHIDAKSAGLYIVVQIIGGLLGTIASHIIFIEHDFFQWVAISEISRSTGTYIAEFIGTFVLILVIFGTIHHKATQPSLIIGLLVGGFLITTSSTMFANPQVTIARIFTWAIAGVRPSDAGVFVVVQIGAALAATGAASYLFLANDRGVSDH